MRYHQEVCWFVKTILKPIEIQQIQDIDWFSENKAPVMKASFQQRGQLMLNKGKLPPKNES